MKCLLPPSGWYCTRERGHDGPCAAVEHADTVLTPSKEWSDLVRRLPSMFLDFREGRGQLTHIMAEIEATHDRTIAKAVEEAREKREHELYIVAHDVYGRGWSFERYLDTWGAKLLKDSPK